ncbi:SMI1/KNR4 family protein [Kordia sp.]|uniref:SMI1/KNR4 family protein n=1 Tax=Kordia sp. TaxID=1965332 RepID=UPI003D6C080F
MRDLNELQLKRGGEQLTEEQYETFLTSYNLILPQSYKEFMLFKNGGYSSVNSYDGGTINFGYSVDEFFMIGEIWGLGERPEGVDVRNVRSTLEHPALVDNITSTLYPFASGGGGVFLCIGKDDHKIYSIYQSDDEPTYVAPSFEDFINGLEDVPYEE